MWIGIELEPQPHNQERIQLILRVQAPTREEMPDLHTMLRGPRMDIIAETPMGNNNHLGLILGIVISNLDLQLNSGQIPIASQRETLHNPLGLQRNQLELKPR